MNTPFKISDRFLPERLRRLERLPIEINPRFFIKRCNIKILVVTDYGGSYGSQNFGLEAFLQAFEEPISYTSFEITKAHRRVDGNADIENFTFTNDIQDFDVIFLFGVERPAYRPPADPDGNPLSENELKAISRFMDDGGGLFATGDHEDLGVDMCGRIPRVRNMRRWYTSANPGPNGEPNAPDQTGAGSHDTIADTNSSINGIQGSQTDITPQTISPKYRYGFASTGFQPFSILNYKKYPHPVLCSPDGVIKFLPDHMHEGLCEVPTNLNASFTFAGYNVEEYPQVNGSKLKPEIVARATNNIDDMRFGVIAALDGHKHSSLGRVLVDATWHHFFNINIRQYQNIKNAINQSGYVPTAAEVVALEKYNYIQHYYRNIAYWLAPRDKQQCFRSRGFQWLLSHNTIAMSLKHDLSNLSKIDTSLYFHTIGVLAKDALGDLQAGCQSSGLTLIQEFFPLKNKISSKLQRSDISFIDPDLFETTCLGCSLHNLNLALIKNKGELKEDQILEIVDQSTVDSMEGILDNIGQSLAFLRKRVRSAK